MTRGSDRLFATLLEDLLTGRYAPGEKLPTQRVLAAEAGVAMSVVREALGRLEQMGLLATRQGDAMRVRDWREHGGLDVIVPLLFRPGGLDHDVLRAVFEARALLLVALAGLAAERRTDAEAGELVVLAGRLAEEREAPAAQLLDFAFMNALAGAARNIVFSLILGAIRDVYLDHAALLPVTADPPALAPLYGRVADAVRDGDPAGARAAIAELAERQTALVAAALAER